MSCPTACAGVTKILAARDHFFPVTMVCVFLYALSQTPHLKYRKRYVVLTRIYPHPVGQATKLQRFELCSTRFDPTACAGARKILAARDHFFTGDGNCNTHFTTLQHNLTVPTAKTLQHSTVPAAKTLQNVAKHTSPHCKTLQTVEHFTSQRRRWALHPDKSSAHCKELLCCNECVVLQLVVACSCEMCWCQLLLFSCSW